MTSRSLSPTVRALPRFFDAALRLGLLAAAGWAFAEFLVQLRVGLVDTGMNRPVFWGVDSANFIFCVGLSAGAIAVAASIQLLGKRELASVALVSEILAVVCLVLAVAFIVIELGRPDRMLTILAHPHFASPLLWDVLAIGSFLPLLLAMLYFGTRAEILERTGLSGWRRWVVATFSLGYTSLSPRARRFDRRVLRALCIVALPGAAVLHSVTAWILGLIQAQPGWNTPLLGAVFLTSALISGLAAVIAVALAARPMFQIEFPDDAIRKLTRFLVGLVPLLLYFLFSEFLTALRSGRPHEVELYREILGGRFAAIFWFDIVAGLVLPLALLTVRWNHRSMGRIALACLLLIAGVFAERAYILLPSLMQSHGFAGRTYVPTPSEWQMMAGTYALGALAFLLLMELLVPRRKAIPAPVAVASPSALVPFGG